MGHKDGILDHRVRGNLLLSREVPWITVESGRFPPTESYLGHCPWRTFVNPRLFVWTLPGLSTPGSEVSVVER